MANSRRVYKIAERLREIIAVEVQRISDSRLSLVTITAVVLSNDMRHAKVYWIVTGDEERHLEVDEAFQEIGGIIRKAVAKALGIRFTPELKFLYDDTQDNVDKLESLFQKIRSEDSSK